MRDSLPVYINHIKVIANFEGPSCSYSNDAVAWSSAFAFCEQAEQEGVTYTKITLLSVSAIRPSAGGSNWSMQYQFEFQGEP